MHRGIFRSWRSVLDAGVCECLTVLCGQIRIHLPLQTSQLRRARSVPILGRSMSGKAGSVGVTGVTGGVSASTSV